MEERRYQSQGLTIAHLWCLIVIVGIFIFVNTHPIRPQDFWWHMAIGREILETGQIPTTDTLSYTMTGASYPAYQMFWLMEVALYAIYRAGGPALIVFVQSVVITAAYALLLLLAKHISGSWRVAALSTLFAAALGLNDWNVRPQAITFPIAALFLFAIHANRERPRSGWIALFPLGMALWVNSHGTFPIGLLIIGAWVAQEAWTLLRERLQRGGGQTLTLLRAPVVALVTSTLACLLNPRGLGIVDYLSGMAESTMVQRFVPEWAPPTFDTLAGQLFYGGLLLSVAVLALSRKRPTLFQLGTFLAFAALGLKTSRGLIWFGIVAAPTLAHHLPDLGHQLHALLSPRASAAGTAASTRLNYALATLILVTVIVTLPWFKPFLPLPALKAGLISQETPVEATRFLLKEQPPGPLFHTMSFGSYLAWEAQPKYPVFVDSRIELYPLEVWGDYIQISAAAPGWEERLEAYGVRTLMVSPQEQAGLVEAAETSPNWEEIYADDTAVVFMHTE